MADVQNRPDEPDKDNEIEETGSKGGAAGDTSAEEELLELIRRAKAGNVPTGGMYSDADVEADTEEVEIGSDVDSGDMPTGSHGIPGVTAPDVGNVRLENLPGSEAEVEEGREADKE